MKGLQVQEVQHFYVLCIDIYISKICNVLQSTGTILSLGYHTYYLCSFVKDKEFTVHATQYLGLRR